MNIYILQKFQFDENMNMLESQVLGAYKEINNCIESAKRHIMQECNDNEIEECLLHLEKEHGCIFETNHGHGFVQYKFHSVLLN